MNEQLELILSTHSFMRFDQFGSAGQLRDCYLQRLYSGEDDHTAFCLATFSLIDYGGTVADMIAMIDRTRGPYNDGARAALVHKISSGPTVRIWTKDHDDA